ncbi:hypothetical protein Hanom_Chr08g00701531 [Helianthus anomalus]
MSIISPRDCFCRRIHPLGMIDTAFYHPLFHHPKPKLMYTHTKFTLFVICKL